MKVAPWFNGSPYPYTITHICVALTRTGDTANWTFNLNFYDTTGSGGGPGVLVDSIPNLTATNIGIWPNVTWHSFDSLTGIPTLTHGSYIICLSYDPCASLGLYIAIDQYGPNPMPCWGYIQGVWSQPVQAPSHLGIRAEQVITGVSGNSNEIPKTYKLYNNYPNPFNPVSTIRYDLPHSADVKLIVFNTLGQEVATLINGHYQAGSYSVIWDGTNYPSGVYFYKIYAGNFTDTKKMLLVK